MNAVPVPAALGSPAPPRVAPIPGAEPSAHSIAEVAGAPRTERWTLALTLVVTLWVVVLFEPHLWLASHGLTLLPSLPPLLFLGLLFGAFASSRRKVWYFPFLALIVGGAVMTPFAENAGAVFDTVIKILLLFYILAIGTLTFVGTIEKSRLLLHLFFWQFLWWSLQAALRGGVPWHAALGNEDAFGPLMVIGAGYCFYFGLSLRRCRLRTWAFCLAAVCVAGVVSSFARGAMLAAGIVAVYMWLRSPRKGRTATALLVGAAVVVITADLLFPRGLFWEEMSTAADGFNTWTGYDRRVLWKTAWRAFLDSPLLGVGAGNFGVYSGTHLWSDPELMSLYRSPGRLWGRVPHSVYFQLLAEFGLVGVLAFLAMLADFWRRNVQLRSEPFTTAWKTATRGESNLRVLSLGLHAAMVAYLTTGIFYDQLYVHWFYSIATLNVVLHRSVRLAATRQRPARFNPASTGVSERG